MFRSFVTMIITEEKICEMVEKCTAKYLAEGIFDMFKSAKSTEQNFTPGFYHIPQFEIGNNNTNNTIQNNQQRRRGFQLRQGRTIKDLIYYFENRGSTLIGRKDTNLVVTALDYFWRNFDDYEDIVSSWKQQQ
jgi:hypothetical protein